MKLPLITTHNLAVGHGGKALIHSIDVQLRTGELVVLIGVNGGGKTTLINTLAGSLEPVQGHAAIQGMALTRIAAMQRAKHISVVYTGRPQVGLLDVRTIVGLGRQPWTGHFGRFGVADHRAVNVAMERMQVLEYASRTLQHLSDGEAQRVMIARALAQETPVILLDEPMAFLDLVNRVRLLRTLRDLAHREQKAILLSTHDLHTALEWCDRAWLVHESGLWCGTPAEVRSTGILQKIFAGEVAGWP